MATIITVHGTGASGPEAGQDWWQEGSPFEAHIRTLVDAKDGRLDFYRLIWDGNNSEISRRKAATRLLAKMHELEKRGDRYCVIGHSHGGSVISYALMLASRKEQLLMGLSKWVTVGTPFIHSTRTYLLFSRLGLLAKTAYLSVLSVCVIFLVALLWSYLHGSEVQFIDSDVSQLAVISYVAILITPFITLHLVLWYLNSRKFFFSRQRLRLFVDKSFGTRGAALYHQDDEAVEGLKSLQRISINVFPSRFAVPAFTSLSVFLVPIALIFAISHSGFVLWTFSLLGKGVTHTQLVRDGRLVGLGSDISVNISLYLTSLGNVIRQFSSSEGTVVITGVVVLPVLFYLISLLLTTVIVMTATGISIALSRLMDRLTWSQIRSSACGGDALGEFPSEVRDNPLWLHNRFHPLPDVLGKEIASFSNMAAVEAVGRLRSMVRQLAFGNERDARAIFFSDCLTWDELIHTAYFKVPRFRMLVAHVIAHGEGFSPSTAFQDHPDGALIARWYEEVQTRRAA